MGERHISFVHIQSERDFVRRLLGQDTDRTWTGYFFFLRYISRYKRTSFLSQILLSYTDRQFTVNKSEWNILPPIPSTNQERTLPSGIHLQPQFVHTVVGQATTFSLRFCIWDGQCFGTMRRNQPLGQSKSVTSGLFERTAEGFVQQLKRLNTSLAVTSQPSPRTFCAILPAACPFL